jgi:hypothetical protein
MGVCVLEAGVGGCRINDGWVMFHIYYI